MLELDTTGNIVLTDGDSTIWASNTSNEGVETAYMSESGNFILYNGTNFPLWQSFSYPSDTLLPNQPLTVSMQLTSSKSPGHGGYYTLQMLQQPTSLSLGLTYNLPDSYMASSQSYSNYSYWTGPDISNITGDVVAVLDDGGSFGIMYGSSSNGAVYVYKSDSDETGLSTSVNRTVRPSVLRRLTLEMNGNLRLYRWDNDLNGTRQWVPEWAAVSNPCDIAGVCGNGVCSLDRSKTNASCSCLPGTSKVGDSGQCWEDSSAGKCDDHDRNFSAGKLKMSMVQQTNYYYPESSIIANYSDNITPLSKCGDACLSDCDCVASVYGLSEEKPYCWLLKSLEFGGFEDTSSTLFVKVGPNASTGTNKTGSGDSSDDIKNKVLVLPIVLSMIVLLGLLCLLLYYSVYRRRALKRALESSLIVSGAPMNFSYRDLQYRTGNFSQLIGTGQCIHMHI